MSIRKSQGKARPELPRSSELAPGEPDPTRSAGRGPDGRFLSGNPHASHARWRQLITESLGRDLPGRAGELGREASRYFRAFLSDMPADCASVRALVAQRARACALAAAYARAGAELGEGSPAGMAALGEALKWDARAERLAVTSWDVATKVAGKRPEPIDAHAVVMSTFGRKG